MTNKVFSQLIIVALFLGFSVDAQAQIFKKKKKEEKRKARETYEQLKLHIDKTINAKKKERNRKINEAKGLRDTAIKQVQEEIAQEQRRRDAALQEVRESKNTELESKGANTAKIQEIDAALSGITAELSQIEKERDKGAEYKKDKRELFDKERDFREQKKLLDRKVARNKERHEQQSGELSSVLRACEDEITALDKQLALYQDHLQEFDNFSKTDVYKSVEELIFSYPETTSTDESCRQLIHQLYETDSTIKNRYTQLQEYINKFTGNFGEDNLFNFTVKLNNAEEYFEFAKMLTEFVEEDKIVEFKKRVEARFAHIISQIGNETNALIEKEGEIAKVIREINNDFVARQFVTAVKSVELKNVASSNRIFQLLLEIKNYNDEHALSIGTPSLFSSDASEGENEKAISLLKQLIKELAATKETEITLSDSFELLFKIEENENTTGWVEKLSNVGSEGTDVLVKAMINIMLLNVFKEKASKKQKNDFALHCMMDEIGKLHPNNVKGILRFANARNIHLINSSPVSLNPMEYAYTYLLTKNQENIMKVTRLIKKMGTPKIQAATP